MSLLADFLLFLLECFETGLDQVAAPTVNGYFSGAYFLLAGLLAGLVREGFNLDGRQLDVVLVPSGRSLFLLVPVSPLVYELDLVLPLSSGFLGRAVLILYLLILCFHQLPLGQPLFQLLQVVHLLTLYLLVNLTDFLVEYCHAHDRLTLIRLFSLFLEIHIQSIDRIHFLVHFLHLVHVANNLVFLQFLRPILLFELAYFYHLFSSHFVVLLVL